ncbi:pantoate--beta-alanine ligase [Paenibacillus sp. ACRRX]|uniref:pantoate--beta-alanine ligase n=1 Tax=Paenibacillus sp. ACRRX TaxID=2918206 RepID=UPI001EF63F1F|nr:pantoate--beta-alanine ligase [Paenibacillus sp. ACRRX]MCG7406487.1 pantoate--beta-alanine ligase [Paenibacillus sp. ACRRX]
MLVVRTIAELRTAIKEYRYKQRNCTVGFVPTMGYLHNGHASLMRRSAAENEVSVLSIFVNPIQFGPNEDLDRYPRDEQRDLALAELCGIDIVFLPSVEMMYPQETKTKVVVAQMTASLCGASRPGHFDGVTTVVSKLFHMVQPDRAYFGMKDAQQIAVLQQMVYDLNMDVELVPCPIVREEDGLALSSRNVYLSEDERAQALVLSQSLGLVSEWLAVEPTVTAGALADRIRTYINGSPLAEIEYVEVVAFPSLQPLTAALPMSERTTDVLIALAVRFGATRLIDNRLLQAAEEE